MCKLILYFFLIWLDCSLTDSGTNNKLIILYRTCRPKIQTFTNQGKKIQCKIRNEATKITRWKVCTNTTALPHMAILAKWLDKILASVKEFSC